VFGGVFSADEVDDIDARYPIAAVINTEPRGSSKNGHWVALLQTGDSVEYFDPLGDRPPPGIAAAIARRIKAQGLPWSVKLKVNNVQQQRDDTDSCGHHVIDFITRRFKGEPFPRATGYDVSDKKDDEVVERHAKRFGYI